MNEETLKIAKKIDLKKTLLIISSFKTLRLKTSKGKCSYTANKAAKPIPSTRAAAINIAV